jgi:hypothetical protein
MKRGLWVILLLLAVQPLWAHGEQVIYLFGFLYYVIPAALLLLIPWYRFRVRLLAVAVLAVGASVAWRDLVSHSGPFGETRARLLLYGPAVLGIAAAILLRVLISARRAAESSPGPPR